GRAQGMGKGRREADALGRGGKDGRRADGGPEPLGSGAHATRENVSMDIKPLWTCQHIRLKRCREGAMLYTINDTYIGRALDKYGEISRDEVPFSNLPAPE